jgi:putative tryptophan/tyrosine transport system substrate-binding protein
MFNPNTAPYAVLFSQSVEAAAQKFGVEPAEAAVQQLADVEAVMSMLAREPGGGLIVLPDPFTTAQGKLIGELAARFQLPAIYPFRFMLVDGGLASYGVNTPDLFRQAASNVDRIFRGEKPADLPVQQPTKFEFVINLKTAKALVLTVPATLLARADEVIE